MAEEENNAFRTNGETSFRGPAEVIFEILRQRREASKRVFWFICSSWGANIELSLVWDISCIINEVQVFCSEQT